MPSTRTHFSLAALTTNTPVTAGVRRMKIGKQVILSVSLSTGLLSGCFYSHTDFVRVEPVKFVPAPSTPKPNTTFGWVEVSKDEAQGYVVRVGDLTYQRIIEPHKVDGEIKLDAAVNAFASFAEEKVVALHYCSSARVPENARKLIGGNTPPEMHIYVECVLQ